MPITNTITLVASLACGCRLEADHNDRVHLAGCAAHPSEPTDWRLVRDHGGVVTLERVA